MCGRLPPARALPAAHEGRPSRRGGGRRLARPQLQGPGRGASTRRSMPTGGRCWCARGSTTPTCRAAPRHVRPAAHGVRVREDALVMPEEALVPQGDQAVRLQGRRRPNGKVQAAGGRIGLRLAGKVEVLGAWRRATWWSRPVRPADAQRRQPVRLVDIASRRRQPKRARWARRRGSPGARGPGRHAAPAPLSRPPDHPHRSTHATVRNLDPPAGAGHVMSLLLILIGLVSFKQLTVREYPRIDEPVVTVSTRLLGASSEVIESQVTKPLEDSIAGIDGVDIITSISRTEQSQITVRFKLTKNPDTPRPRCATAFRPRARALPDAWTSRSSPRSRPTPRPPSGWPTPARRCRRWSSPTSSTASSSRACRRCPAWPTCRSAATASYAMRIWLDPDKLAAYRLTVQDVEDALRGRTSRCRPAASRAAARVQRHRAHRPEHRGAVRRHRAAHHNGYTVRLRDVARVEEAAASERSRRAPERRAVDLHRRDPQCHRQSAGGGRRRACGDAADPARPAAVGHRGAGQRQLGLHRPLDQGRLHHRGRGGGAGGAGGVRVPAHAAGVDHSAGHDPGQPDRQPSR
jgi:hypothetical protein